MVIVNGSMVQVFYNKKYPQKIMKNGNKVDSSAMKLAGRGTWGAHANKRIAPH